MTNPLLDPSVIIAKAASRIRGDRLDGLITLCMSQKTVSTRRLKRFVEELRKSDHQDGVHFKALAEFIRETGP